MTIKLTKNNTSLDTKMSLLTCSVYVWKFDIPDTSSWTNSAAWHITSFALTWCLRSCVGTFNLLNSLMPTKYKEYMSLLISVFNYNKLLYNNIGAYWLVLPNKHTKAQFPTANYKLTCIIKWKLFCYNFRNII